MDKTQFKQDFPQRWNLSSLFDWCDVFLVILLGIQDYLILKQFLLSLIKNINEPNYMIVEILMILFRIFLSIWDASTMLINAASVSWLIILTLFNNLGVHWTPLHTPVDQNPMENIPILPKAFLTFASKSSLGPSYVANGQQDHKSEFWILNENDKYTKPAWT